ncbi:uncharacterized protein LOC108627079, partial [Ceratina calcarata]|uniref:Uncharacterized protein LOC108627079 n=1 Tax=Ceratina calcarata TaxID=156304 RepID=A0AAJ7N917_9HYME
MAGYLKFVQINLHRSRAAVGALSNLMVKDGIDIALIQEPWTVNDKIKGMGMTGNVLYNCNDQRPRTCIVHTGRIKPVLLPQFSDRDITTALMEKNNERSRLSKLIIVSVYMPYDRREPVSEKLDLLVDWCVQQGISMLVGADANACHILWGSSVTNNRGLKLLDFMNINGLTWLNEGLVPTFSTSIREETLDVTMVSLEIRSALSQWKVLDDLSLSDHRFISFKLLVEGVPINRIVSDKKLLNVEKFLESLNDKLRESPKEYGTPLQIDVYVEFVTDAIMKAAEEALEKKMKRFNGRLPWWNSKLQDLSRKGKSLKRKARRTGRSGDKHKARRAELKLNREIRKAKKNSWRSFCSGLKKTQEIARINRVLERVDQNSLGLLRKRDGTMTGDVRETLETLIAEHFPGALNMMDVDDNAGGRNTSEMRPVRPNWSLAASIITEERVGWAISTLLPYKAPGPDEIIP